jgi:hypothetical protein
MTVSDAGIAMPKKGEPSWRVEKTELRLWHRWQQVATYPWGETPTRVGGAGGADDELVAE